LATIKVKQHFEATDGVFLLGEKAPVHRDRGACHEGALLGGQEEDALGHIVGGAHALDKVILDGLRHQLLLRDAQLYGVVARGRSVDASCKEYKSIMSLIDNKVNK
jgi:hypothetical protein